jgi:hypothetical protein
MPFKSQAQRRKFYAMEDRGEISKKTLNKWEDETPKGKKLPERVKQAEPPPPKGVSAKEWDKILQGLPKSRKSAYYSTGMKLALAQLGLLQGETS